MIAQMLIDRLQPLVMPCPSLDRESSVSRNGADDHDERGGPAQPVSAGVLLGTPPTGAAVWVRTGERMEEMRGMVLSSCQIFFRTRGVALLLRVARRERHDFRMHRTEDSIALAIGSHGSDRNLLISEVSKSVPNSSVRACIPGVSPSVEMF